MAEYWYLWLILALSVILCVFVFYKAAKASGKRRAAMDKRIEELKKENCLRVKYKTLTAELLSSAQMPELLEGVTANIQSRLESSQDMLRAFGELPPHEQYIYTLNYLVTDSADNLSEFLKKNGEPLISLAPEALEAVESGIAPIVAKMYPMYDENNETVSYNESEIESLNKEYAAALDIEHLYAQIQKYIIEHH